MDLGFAQQHDTANQKTTLVILALDAMISYQPKFIW